MLFFPDEVEGPQKMQKLMVVDVLYSIVKSGQVNDTMPVLH